MQIGFWFQAHEFGRLRFIFRFVCSRPSPWEKKAKRVYDEMTWVIHNFARFLIKLSIRMGCGVEWCWQRQKPETTTKIHTRLPDTGHSRQELLARPYMRMSVCGHYVSWCQVYPWLPVRECCNGGSRTPAVSHVSCCWTSMVVQFCLWCHCSKCLWW